MSRFWVAEYFLFLHQNWILSSLYRQNMNKFATLVDGHYEFKFLLIRQVDYCYESLCSRRDIYTTDSQVRLATSIDYHHV